MSTKISPDDPSKTADGQEKAVRRMLKQSRVVVSADNKQVIFGPTLLNHWVEKGKTEEDKQGRLRHIREAVRAISAPHEIWEQANGQRTYFRVYKDGKGAFYMAGFVVGSSGDVRSLVFTRKKGTARSQRKGTLRYKRQ